MLSFLSGTVVLGQGDIYVVKFSQFQPSSFKPGDRPTRVAYTYGFQRLLGNTAVDFTLTGEIYLSKNSAFGDGDDIFIGSVQDSDWAEGDDQAFATYSIENNPTGVRIPEGIPGGAYHVFIRVTSSLQGDLPANGLARFAELISIADTVPPSVSISRPLAGERFGVPGIEVSGIAADDSGLQSISVMVENFGGTNTYAASGTTDWSVNVSIAPGTNTIRAVAVDSFGHTATNSTTCVYATNDVLTLIVTPGGSVTPNFGATNLTLGQRYTVIAKASPGFVFEGWTGSIVSKSNLLTFTMQLDMSLTARFRDLIAPELVVNSPKTNLRFTNATIRATGTAKDNDRVGAVKFQVNGGEWIAATGTTNWQADIALAPGPNAIKFVAEDRMGLRSKTNSIAATYVKTAPLDLTIIGSGKVTPLANGRGLEIGKSHLITAAPSVGFAFAGWTGSTNKSSASLSFVMREGFRLVATFRDNTKPNVAITSPKAYATVTNLTVTATGSAVDNVAVSNVFYRIDNSTWQQAIGTNQWSATFAAARGSHTLQAYAVDLAGNVSKTTSVAFTIPIYKGIFSGTLSGQEHQAILVRADQSAIFVGGRADYRAWVSPFQVRDDGWFEFIADDELFRGIVSSTGVATLHADVNSEPSSVIFYSGRLSRRAATGIQAANTGYYTGASSDGPMHAILSADGQITFTLSQPGPLYGGGKGIVAANNKFSASALGANLQGILDPILRRISGTIRRGAQTSTFQMQFEFGVDAPVVAPMPLLLQPVIAPVLEVEFSSGSMSFLFGAEPGRHYAIEVSPDLETWLEFKVIQAETERNVYSMPISESAQFVRVRAR